MQEMTASTWKRTGSSMIWHPDLLADLIRDVEPTSLRVVLGWLENGFPENPPGGGRRLANGRGNHDAGYDARCRGRLAA